MSRDDGKDALQIVEGFYGLLKAVQYYDANNAAVGRLIDLIAVVTTARETDGAGPLRITLLTDEFFANGQLLRVDAKFYEKATVVADVLAQQRFTDVVIEPPVPKETLLRLTADLAALERKTGPGLSADGYPGIRFLRQPGRSIASYRFEPDRLAIWVVASLLDLADQLYARAQKRPSLVPVKRLLQMTVDGMAENPGVYELLTSIRDPHGGAQRVRQRVAIAIEMIGFATALGLRPTERLDLGLAGLLGGLSESSDPDEAVVPLFDLPGLGDTAVALTMAVHGARAAERGQESGASGKMLATLEWYVRAAIEASPAQAIASLAQSPTDLARAFAAYKGTYPIGSLVTLDDRRVAVVVGPPDERGRPRLAPIQGDRVLSPASLNPETTIATATSALSAGVAMHELKTEEGPAV